MRCKKIVSKQREDIRRKRPGKADPADPYTPAVDELKQDGDAVVRGTGAKFQWTARRRPPIRRNR